MKISSNSIFLALLLLTAVVVSACSNNQAAKDTANSTSANNTAIQASPSPTPAASSPTPAASPEKAAVIYSTPAEAFKAAFAFRKNKDGAGLKNVLSRDILEFFTEIGKAGNRSLDQMLQELAEKPQGISDEVRNVKINGDKATLEYQDDKGAWKPLDFVKEDGSWKMTLAKPEKPAKVGPKAGKAEPPPPPPAKQ